MAKETKRKVKTIKKKTSKKKLKRSEEQEVEEVEEVAYDEDEQEEEDLNADCSGEEEDDERRRQKLVEAISSMGGTRRRGRAERSEAAVCVSEFGVSVHGAGGKMELSELIPNTGTGRTVRKTRCLPVDRPLSRQETERIQRDLAFQKTATEVAKWTSLIRQNQRAEQLVFPLNQEPAGPRPMERVVMGWKARTPLEQEIMAVLSANKQPVHDPVLTPQERASMAAMSLEEAKIRRAELQKARALQSYYEARARREGKIKSKKYHKVQNKAKRKEHLKKFDEMVRTDPAGGLEELKKMELTRMQERMSLKHQNSGKWAKSKAIMAKYDEDARKAMQQQLEVNKELTQKVATALGGEEEEEEEEEEGDEVMPECVNDVEPAGDPSNPWMRGKLSEDPADKEASEDLSLEVEKKPEEEEEEEEEEQNEEEALLREFDSRRKQRQAEEEEPEEDEHKASDKEDEELNEFTKLFLHQQEANPTETMAADMASSGPLLEEGLTRIRTLEDVELLSKGHHIEENPVGADPEPVPATVEAPCPSENKTTENSHKRKRGIELKHVLTKTSKVIEVPITPMAEESEDGDEELDQRGLIREAFAGDDVISDFLKDKQKQEEAGKPKTLDLTLPGWGEWGGVGLQPSRKKRRRFRTRAATPPPRKDHSLPSVIISEKRNSSISLHQVNTLPFPFENHSQFESIVRCPLGRTWNTERTVQRVTMPRVVTQLGAIIQPMSREELLKDQKQQGGSGKMGNAVEKKHQLEGRHKPGRRRK